MSHAFLSQVPLFADLSEADLERLAQAAEELHIAAGEVLFDEGSPGQHAYVIAEGELEILKAAEGRQVLLAVRKAGDVIGEMALLEAAPRMATVRARTDGRLMAIPKDSLDRLLSQSPGAVNRMFQNVLSRLRDSQTMLRQSEKMAQLGLLTAGVAHELNNPAAAIQRSAGQLTQALDQLVAGIGRLGLLKLDPNQEAVLASLTERARRHVTQSLRISSLERSDRSEALASWYADQLGKRAQPEVIASLVDIGLVPDELDQLAQTFSGEQLEVLLDTSARIAQVFGLMPEIGEASRRISTIVGSLKSYSYLDQAPIQSVDVHQGLEDTLLIFNHYLKEGIEVHREYAEDLPRIQAYGSELNQVWTNLFDNAIQAMQGRGELRLRTRQEGDWVIVEVEDNGPGIPEEHQAKIYDAFFTTKPPGAGTGLGLNIVYNIIVDKHRGDIRLKSQPGRTVFEVMLPIQAEARD
jgi:signal transduction histidine kinase